MTSVFQIPLSPQAQHFDVALNGNTYNMSLVWNPAANAWILDLFDGNGNALVQGLPLVTGADLLQQFAYLGLGGALMVDQVPTFESLGTIGQLFFVTP